jgi:hypothetical protein
MAKMAGKIKRQSAATLHSTMATDKVGVATARRHTVFNRQPSHPKQPLPAGGNCFFCWEGAIAPRTLSVALLTPATGPDVHPGVCIPQSTGFSAGKAGIFNFTRRNFTAMIERLTRAATSASGRVPGLSSAGVHGWFWN